MNAMRQNEKTFDIIRHTTDLEGTQDIYIGHCDRREELQDFSLAHAEEHIAKVYRLEHAPLLAAAPELLRALKGLCDVLPRHLLTECTEVENAYAVAHAAICKVEEDLTP